MSERVRIVDPDPRVEHVLEQLDARVNKTIVGLDGNPLFKPLVDDRTITYSKDGEAFSLDPEQTLMRAARMLRDGMSLERIRDELDLIKTGPHAVPLRLLDAAIRNYGMPLLDLAIREGREPAESVRVVGYDVVDPEARDDRSEATDADALRVAREMTNGR